MPGRSRASSGRSGKSRTPLRTTVGEEGPGREVLDAVAADVKAAVAKAQDEASAAPTQLEARGGQLAATIIEKQARAKARAAKMRKRGRSFSAAATQRAEAMHKRCRRSVQAAGGGSALQQCKEELLAKLERTIDPLVGRLAK